MSEQTLQNQEGGGTTGSSTGGGTGGTTEWPKTEKGGLDEVEVTRSSTDGGTSTPVEVPKDPVLKDLD